MKKFIFFIPGFLCCSCSNSGQEVSHFQKKIFSKKYTLEFSIERVNLDTVQAAISEKIYGSIIRDNDYLYSKSSSGTGIFQDSLCLFIDNIDSTITINKMFSISTLLLVPFYDPLEIFSYAIDNNSSYEKVVRGEKIDYDFKFPSNNVSVKHILITENENNNSFVIEFTYQRLSDKIKEIISYKILPDSINKWAENIEDYVEEKNSKFSLRPKFKNYIFFNNAPLEAILKGQ